jgi:hypothetical protein
MGESRPGAGQGEEAPPRQQAIVSTDSIECLPLLDPPCEPRPSAARSSKGEIKRGFRRYHPPMPTLTLNARRVGRRGDLLNQPLTLDLRAGAALTLSDLLKHIVRNELAEYKQRQSAGMTLRVLTEAAIDEGQSIGAIKSGPPDAKPKPPPSLKRAHATATQAFADGLFYVFVDNAQIMQLDEKLVLRDGGTILFLRLVALAGG